MLQINDVPINNFELLNIQAWSLNVLKQALHPISSGKLQVLSIVLPSIH